MRVLVDALGIQQPGGGRTATLNLLRGLAAIDDGDEWVVLLNKKEPSLAQGARMRQVVLPVANRFVARMVAEVLLPLMAARYGVDLVHHAKNLLTAFSPCPRVATLYDLTILVRPDLYPAVDVAYWRHIEPKLLRRADRVIAISRTTARELSSLYRIDAPQVEVVYPGYDPSFTPDPGVDWRTLSRYGLRPGYVLHVGSISRKKNLLPLVRAVEVLRCEGWDGQLALVGRVYDKGRDHALFEYVSSQRLGDAVRMTGPVPQPDLVSIYRGARAFVFPSVHEGFGLVPVEAMACGVPVISSGGGALNEVLGGAATILNDCSDERALADAVRSAASDGPERRDMIARGLERARCFTRELSVRRTLEIYRSVVGR